jgi:hypothetical protein
MSGLNAIADTAPSNDGEYFFVRNTDPVVVDNLLATTVITDTLNLDGQAITADETAIFLNGVPYGGGGGGGTVQTVTGTAPITVTGTVADPIVGIDLSNIVTRSGAQTITGAKKFGILPQAITGVLPTDNDELVPKLYVDNTIETWSQFPATQDVNMGGFKIANCAELANNMTGFGLTITSDEDIAIEAATGNIDITAQSVILHQTLDVNGYNLTGVGDIIGTTSNMLITTTTDITLKADEGVVQIDAKNLVITSNAPPGQLVSDSTLQISTDNDMTITATDMLLITAGGMIINNDLSMGTHKIINVVNPTDPQDVATKAYVDGSIPGADTLANVLLAGNSAGATSLNMNGQDITGVNDITMTGLVPTISAPLSATLTVAGLGVTTVAAGTHLNLTAPDYVSIGSAGYTTIENLKITNSVIEKVPGQLDLSFENVRAVTNTGANMAIGNNQILLNASGAVTVNSLNGTLSIQSGAGLIDIVGSTTISGNQLNLRSGQSITLDNSVSTTAPISLQTGTTENVCIQSGVPGTPLADSSILNVSSDSKGIYIPRMTAVQRDAISNPQNGLLVFDTTASALYMYGARGWAKVALTNSANELLQSLSGLDGGVRTYSLTGLTEVDTLAVKTNAIQPLDPLIGTDVAVEAQLVWEGDILLKNNGNSAGTDVLIDSIPAAPASLGNVVSYDPTSKKLYYQAAGGGGGGAVNSVVAGSNINVNSIDPANPVVNLDDAIGVTAVGGVAGFDLNLTPSTGQLVSINDETGTSKMTVGALGVSMLTPVNMNGFALTNSGGVTAPGGGAQGLGFTGTDVQLAAINGDIFLTPGQLTEVDRFIRAQGDIRIESNQASSNPGSLNFVGTGTPLLLNSSVGTSGNLLISGGADTTPGWSTGLRYDTVRKVLFAG